MFFIRGSMKDNNKKQLSGAKGGWRLSMAALVLALLLSGCWGIQPIKDDAAKQTPGSGDGVQGSSDPKGEVALPQQDSHDDVKQEPEEDKSPDQEGELSGTEQEPAEAGDLDPSGESSDITSDSGEEQAGYGYLREIAEMVFKDANDKRQHKLSWNEQVATAAEEKAEEMNEKATVKIPDPINRLSELGVQYGKCTYSQALFEGADPQTLNIEDILKGSEDQLLDESFEDIGIGVHYGKTGIAVSIILTATEENTPSGGEIQTDEPAKELSGIYLGEIEKEIWERVNEERQKAGLEPLEWYVEAVKVSKAKAREMYEKSYFAHESPYSGSMKQQFQVFGGLVLGENVSAIGENIAMSSGRSQDEVDASFWMDMWMASPGHKANILNENFTHLGVSVYYGEDGRAYAVQEFCTPY